MTPIDAINFFSGELRLVTHHYGSRSETVLIHVPTMRQITVANAARVSAILTDFEAQLADSLETFEVLVETEGVPKAA